MTGQLGDTGEARAQGAALPFPQIDGFTILGSLGAGPSGHTWHARHEDRAHRGAEAPVAAALGAAGLRRPVREGDSASHGAAPPPHRGAGRSRAQGDHFFLATEYLPGGSLQKRPAELRETPAALRLTLEVSRALHHAHAHGMQHRGLKPENILLSASGDAKVADFGLARLRDDEASTTSHYTAPEQGALPLYADGRADLYALATVLYELLYSERPPRPWSPAASKVPVRDTRLFSLFSQSLADNPAQRFRRIQDFTEELERILDTGPGAPQPPALAVGQASGPLSLEVRGRTVYVKVRARGDAEWLKRSLLALEQVIRQPGPWGVAYNLSEMAGWSTREIDVVVDLHRRYEKNLRRVGFSSPLPAVRSGGMLVGTSVKEVPWNTFASPQALQDWAEGGTQQ